MLHAIANCTSFSHLFILLILQTSTIRDIMRHTPVCYICYSTVTVLISYCSSQIKLIQEIKMNVSNTSFDEDSAQLQWDEFPQWIVLSILVLGYWLLSVLPTVAMSSSVLVAMKNNPLNKPLTMIHVYVLVTNTLVRVCSAVAIATYAPSVLRYCICSTAAGSVSFYLHIYNVCYQPLTLMILAVFQLLIIKGKKMSVSYRNVGVVLIVITVLALLISLLFTIVRLRDGDTFLCAGTCPGIPTSHLLLLFGSYVAVVWIPSLLMTVTVTMWSCVIFKRSYAGRDSGLNRRIISVPLIMPTIIMLTTISTFGLFRVADQISTLSADPYVHNWTVSVKFVILLVNEISSGFSYPCLILFLNPKLLESWRILFQSKVCCLAPWIHNQVNPSQ